MTDWIKLFAVYREVVIRDEEIIQGMLLPELQPQDRRVRDALAGWEGTHFLHQTPFGTELTLVRRRAARPRERWWLHLLLGLLTLLTTTFAGAYLAGSNPLRLYLLTQEPWYRALGMDFSPRDVVPGLQYSVPLLGILFGHEMGHYLLARRHRMDVSPPYFIPSPSWINLIGTFGAFIRIRSPMVNRWMLLDVGVAGPLASFVLSLPVLVAGLVWSQPLGPTSAEQLSRYAVLFGAYPLWVGDSLLVRLLSSLVWPGAEGILLHPVAFAGWLGLLFTSLNLLPVSQLDGGHILYALSARVQRWAGMAFLVLLAVLGWWWSGWWVWAAAILLVGRGKVRHPSVFDPSLSVTDGRKWLGWACIFIFFITFVPFPLRG